MKRMLLPPIFVLAVLLAFSLWNIRRMEGETDRWREQLQAADRLALSGEWAEALDALWESYDDWSHSQTYLHIVSHHDAVDDAEAMYRRAIAFGETEELSGKAFSNSPLYNLVYLLFQAFLNAGYNQHYANTPKYTKQANIC